MKLCFKCNYNCHMCFEIHNAYQKQKIVLVRNTENIKCLATNQVIIGCLATKNIQFYTKYKTSQ